jgi:peptidoglycan L-alanyl-D-glutamate endopeptidase CwlK
MTLGQHQERFSADLARLILHAVAGGYGVRMGEAFRTPEQQQIYVKTGRSKTFNSMHLKKCAADLHFTKDGALCYPEELGRYWESLDPLNSAGMFWRSFKDSPHFERRC